VLDVGIPRPASAGCSHRLRGLHLAVKAAYRFGPTQVALIGITALAAVFGLLSALAAHADTTASVVCAGAKSSAACSDTGATAGVQTAPFCTIQAAIDSPSTGPGTTVLVAASTYAAQVKRR